MSDRFLRVLSAAGIVGVVGPNGGGKDLLIARLAAQGLAAGRPLLANHHVLDPKTGEPHPRAVLMTGLADLMAWDGDIWLSEITTVAGARESSNLPVQVQARVQQLRKGANGSRLWWSAPSFSRADRVLREVSQVIVKTKGYMPERAQADHIWRPRRLFRCQAYDARDLEEFHVQQTAGTTQKHRRMRAAASDWYWRPGKPHQHLYRSLDPVEHVGYAASGTCLVCSGRVRQPVCGGHSEVVDLPPVVPVGRREVEAQQGPPQGEAEEGPAGPDEPPPQVDLRAV